MLTRVYGWLHAAEKTSHWESYFLLILHEYALGDTWHYRRLISVFKEFE